jgi:WD40 repeat protein
MSACYVLIRSVACALALLFTIQAAEAQNEESRRDYATPGLALNTDGRTGACDALLFTNDNQLLAVGDDKVVRSFPLTAQGLGPPDAGKELRWATWQENRGQIFTLALSPDPAQKLLAIAGDGMNQGTVALLDRHTGQVVQGVLGKPSFNSRKIWSMAFAPDGSRIAYGTEDGQVCVWGVAPREELPRKLKGQHAPLLGADGKPLPYNRVRLVAFLSKTRLVSVSESGQALQWDLTADGNAPPQVVFEARKGAIVQHAALSPDFQWLALIYANSRVVELRSLSDKNARVAVQDEKDEADNIGYCLAFDSRGRKLAVGYWKTDRGATFLRELRFDVVVYDVPERAPFPAKLKGKKVAAPTFIPEALAFHPKLDYLAVAGGDNHEVTLWNVTTGKMIGSPAVGKGRCLWGVKLSTNNNYLAFQDTRLAPPAGVNQRGTGKWKLFDLQALRFVDAMHNDTFPPPPPEVVDGWRVHTTHPNHKPSDTENQTELRKSAVRWWLTGPKLAQPVLLPWSAADGLPNCYVLLSAIPGKKPTRLVVGHAWGASVYELVPGQIPKRVRLLVGHEGEVMALAVSTDQKRLVTASRDQTIAGWSLEDWPSWPNLGARIEEVNNELVVDAVDPGSPAWEMGLERNDKIVYLSAGDLTNVVYDKLGGAGQPNGLAKAKALLRDPTPGAQLYLKWTREGRKVPIEQLTSLKQRPLFRFVPSADREWVLWRWRDHFYECSLKGDSLIGWQLNHWQEKGSKKEGTDRLEMLKPTFFTAEQMRKRYQQPQIIQKMLKNWQAAPEAVKLADIAPPDVAIQVPSSSLVQAGKVTIKDADLTLTLHAKPGIDAPLPAGADGQSNQTLTEAILWINDYKYQSWDPRTTPFPKTITLPRALLRHGDNGILLQCYNHGKARGEAPLLVVHFDAPPVQPVLRGLFVGVGDYSRANPKQPPLRSNLDAKDLKAVWEEQKGKLYKDIKILPPMIDEAVTPEKVLAQLEAVARDPTIRPDDVFVFYLGGHGTRVEELIADFKVNPEDLKGLNYLFCCSNFNVNKIRETTINFDKLYEALVKIPCRKLLLLDTCHAGDLAQKGVTTHPIRQLTPDGVGPVIFLACEPHQSALGHPQVDPRTRVSGLFLVALAMTLDEEFESADKNHDNKLVPTEIAASLREIVPQLVERLQKAGLVGMNERQNPVWFIPRMENLFPLAGQN